MHEDDPDAPRVGTQEHGSWTELFPFVLFGVALVATVVTVVLT